jgi:hypothetical protein
MKLSIKHFALTSIEPDAGAGRWLTHYISDNFEKAVSAIAGEKLLSAAQTKVVKAIVEGKDSLLGIITDGTLWRIPEKR